MEPLIKDLAGSAISFSAMAAAFGVSVVFGIYYIRERRAPVGVRSRPSVIMYAIISLAMLLTSIGLAQVYLFYFSVVASIPEIMVWLINHDFLSLAVQSLAGLCTLGLLWYPAKRNFGHYGIAALGFLVVFYMLLGAALPLLVRDVVYAP